jgi:hypothetical protein
MLRLRLALLGLSGLCLAGCANDNAGTPSVQGSNARPAGERISAIDDLPLDVSANFRRDFPNAAITNVTRGSAETGQPTYRITFIQNGAAGGETYFTDGTRLPRATPGVGAGTTGTGTNAGAGTTGVGTGTGTGISPTPAGTGTPGTGASSGTGTTGTGTTTPGTNSGTGTRVDTPSQPNRP